MVGCSFLDGDDIAVGGFFISGPFHEFEVGWRGQWGVSAGNRAAYQGFGFGVLGCLA